MFIASLYLATVRRARSTPPLLERNHDVVVRENGIGPFLIDQRADAVAHSLRRMGVTAILGGADRYGEEILKLEHASRRQHVFVRGHPADCGLVHLDRLSDRLEGERPQVVYAMLEKTLPAAARFPSPPSGWSLPSGRGYGSASSHSAGIPRGSPALVRAWRRISRRTGSTAG
jgi:hypothetical protein